MMNQYGGPGRDINQQGLSRLYQSALRKSQEPWERIMRGQALLQGIQPGQLVGGYTTQVSKPETWQDPTGLGNLVKTGGGVLGLLGSINDIFKLWNQGGYVEKPKKYNEGGIVSGLVPIHMQDGGDPEIPQWVIEALEDPDFDPENMTPKQVAAYEWLAQRDTGEIDDLPIEEGSIFDFLVADPLLAKAEQSGKPGAEAAGILALLGTSGARPTGWKRVPEQLKRLRDLIYKKTGRGGMRISTRPGEGWKRFDPRGWHRLQRTPRGTRGARTDIAVGKDILKGIGKTGILGSAGLLGGSGVLNWWNKDLEDVKVKPAKTPEQASTYFSDIEERIKSAKSKKEKDEAWADLIRTTGRLSEMMHAPGRRETTLADAARIFSEERMGIGEETPEVEKYEALSEMTGGLYSPTELMEANLTGQLPMYGKEALIANIMEHSYPSPTEPLSPEEVAAYEQQKSTAMSQLLLMTVEQLEAAIDSGYGDKSKLLGAQYQLGSAIPTAINTAQGTD